MRTITLELLRHGPAHNQLLSPLTPYLALCENHGAVTWHVPFEHNQFLHRLESLGYRDGSDASSREMQLRDTARILGDLLGAIPGLTAESNKKDGDGDKVVNLRLILSASELALLPFEIALSPAGLPGSGQHLLLQAQMPICLTREIRRAPDPGLAWPRRRPKILFAAAAPPGVGEIPLEAHLLALRKGIQPWMKYYEEDADAESADGADATNKPATDRREGVKTRSERVSEYLTFIPNASIKKIEDACARENFTHVHILAHGVPIPEKFGQRFGIALHDDSDPDGIDNVRGSRLATALRAGGIAANSAMSTPTVVTLASCDSGNQGSVAGAGASVAHALHEAGIPMVVAGQFPLTFPGSVVIVEQLCEGLLQAADPRRLVYELRRRLYSQFENSHDWASLTVYLSLPENFDRILPDIQIDRAQLSIDAAMNHADEILRRHTGGKSNGAAAARKTQGPTVKEVEDGLVSAIRRLEALLVKPSPGDARASEYLARSDKQSRVLGLLASAEKRRAEVRFAIAHSRAASQQAPEAPGPGKKAATAQAKREWDAETIRMLERSKNYYWEAFQARRTEYWALVQYLSLDSVLRFARHDAQGEEPATSSLPDPPERARASIWEMVRLQSLYDLQSDQKEVRAWAYGNLIELYLLTLTPDYAELAKDVDPKRLALDYADGLYKLSANSFELYSTRRQIVRYVDWYGDLTKGGFKDLLPVAQAVLKKWPESVNELYR